MGVRVREKGGKWYVFITYKGIRKARCIGSKEAALKVKKAIEAKLALGELDILKDTPQAPTFQEYAEQWLTQYVTVACKPSSQRIIKGILRNHLIPEFGTYRLDSISRSHVKTFLLGKLRCYRRKYVKDLLRTLHTILAHAVEEEIIERNLASRAGKFLPDQQADPDEGIHPFNSSELTIYLETMRQRYPQHHTLFLCLARTGMRQGEALGLYWDDIQFGRGVNDPHRFIHIRRTYDAANKLFNTPKNGRTRRVDMSRELRSALLELRDLRYDQAILKGTIDIPRVVFYGRGGMPVSPSNLQKIHHRVCEQAGLRSNRVHDLRHSYATIHLFEHRAPIQYVSEQLGHSSIKITVDTYSHPSQGTSIDLADRLDSIPTQPGQSATYMQPDI